MPDPSGRWEWEALPAEDDTDERWTEGLAADAVTAMVQAVEAVERINR